MKSMTLIIRHKAAVCLLFIDSLEIMLRLNINQVLLIHLRLQELLTVMQCLFITFYSHIICMNDDNLNAV